MTKTMRALVPAALAGALLLGGVASATAAPASSPAAATQNGPSTLSYYCGYHDGSKYADRGDRGNHVKEIQCLLRDAWGYNIGSSGVDGKFGGDTEKAVKAFQRDHGLKADGIVGPNTWKKLRG
ncbi:peptidoglycan-binding domain-containing protein [Streptomyces sp. 796.1]|uniref:peptidoglycan-binding domain-containing protein n=1 Tax=Streptomyces sp. 796.1 TaxID=3163029 RepID=UPI0039C8FCD5